MSDSPRHNVGSIADPHWVVDEEHYLKAVADADHFFVLSGKYLQRANDAEAQRDKLMVALKWLDASGGLGLDKHARIREALKECGK